MSKYQIMSKQAFHPYNLFSSCGKQPDSTLKSNFTKLAGKILKVVLGLWELSATAVDKNTYLLHQKFDPELQK